MPLAVPVSNWRVIASDATWVIALRVIRQLLAILVVAVLVRAISQEEFGHYQLIVTLVGVCGAFTLPGMQRAIIQSVARGYRGTFLAGTRITLRYSLLGSLILGAAAAWFWVSGDRALAIALAAVAAIFPLSQGMAQWQSLQLGARQFRENTIRTSAGAIASTVAVMLLVWWGQTSLAALALGTFGVLALQNVYQQRVAERSVKADEPVEPGSLTYGLASSKWDALNTVGNYADRLFLFVLASPEALAAYAVADRIPEVLKTNVSQLTLVVIPRFAKREAYTREMDRKLTMFAAATACALLVVAFTLIPVVIPLLYTVQYAESVLYCQLILVSICVGVFAIVKNSYISSKMDIVSTRRIMLWTSGVRIVASALLVWRFGALGAAISTIVYRLANVVVVEYQLRGHRA